jgi:hypothetical protein
MLVEQ